MRFHWKVGLPTSEINLKADSCESWDDNKIILFSTREICMPNFIEPILQNSHTGCVPNMYNKYSMHAHGHGHLGSRPSARNWTIPMFQLECVLWIMYRLLPNLPWLNIVDHLLCTLWIIVDTFADIHYFLSHVWTVCSISRCACWSVELHLLYQINQTSLVKNNTCPHTKQMKNTAPHVLAAPVKSSS
jgi:hypothetical protein